MFVPSPRGYPLLVLALAVACRSDRPAGDGAAQPASEAAAGAVATTATAAAPAGQMVHVVATDFKFDLPDSIPAGAVTLHMMNQGKELHHAQLVRLDDGKTVADLVAALKPGSPPPAWAHFVGGPNGVVPGASAASTAVLAPGQYAVMCFIPGPDGVPHVAKGMLRGFRVVGSNGGSTLPAATDTIQLTDYTFTSDRPLESGSHTILVQNDGPQPHELVLLRLNPGKTVKDFGVWATTGGMKGPPPAVPIGGVGVLDRGAGATFTADLPAGDYAFICFVEDAKDGKLHVEHGMAKQFRVG
jgi:uncharacterized cupredoxin-like copper-binding protein